MENKFFSLKFIKYRFLIINIWHQRRYIYNYECWEWISALKDTDILEAAFRGKGWTAPLIFNWSWLISPDLINVIKKRRPRYHFKGVKINRKSKKWTELKINVSGLFLYYIGWTLNSGFKVLIQGFFMLN